MSGDLVSLRMIVMTASEPLRRLFSHGAAMASVPIDLLASEPQLSLDGIAAGGCDFCIIDDDLPDSDKSAAIEAARAINPKPLIFLLGAADRERPNGADNVFPKPVDENQATALAEICIRTTFPTRVLIVDDSRTMRSIVRKILSQSRFKLDLHEASEGIEALDELRNGNFGLVFLDCNMPGLNGVETLSEIKRENPDVAVVMMTSAMEGDVVSRAKKAGALAFLKKPFYPADIDAIMERHYGLRKTPEEASAA